jgi:hypothetical protein
MRARESARHIPVASGCIELLATVPPLMVKAIEPIPPELMMPVPVMRIVRGPRVSRAACTDPDVRARLRRDAGGDTCEHDNDTQREG